MDHPKIEPEGHTVMFEGLADVGIEGKAYDVYLTVEIQAMGNLARWYGTLGWVGDKPNMTRPSWLDDLIPVKFSDGRSGVIQVHTLYTDDSGRLEFQGVGFPPGFAPYIAPDDIDHMAEVASSPLTTELVVTRSSWRVWVGRLFMMLSVVSMFSAIWLDEARWQLISSGALAWLLAAAFTPNPPKEAPSDDWISGDK